MSDISNLMAPMKHLMDSFNNSLQLHTQPYGLRASDTKPEHLAMPSFVLDRILDPTKDCACGKSCPGGDRCGCKTRCCLCPGCGDSKACWCMPSAVASCTLPVDIIEAEDAYVLYMDLPDADREHLHVECVSGHHETHHGHQGQQGHQGHQGHEQEQASEGGEPHQHHEHDDEHHAGHHPLLTIGVSRAFDQSKTFLRKERPFGKIVRKFFLPEDALMSQVSSKYDNGVLRVIVPRNKVEPAKRSIVNVD